MTDNADTKQRKRELDALRARQRRAARKAAAVAIEETPIGGGESLRIATMYAEREAELPIDTNGTAVYDVGMSSVTAQATESEIVALLSRHEDGFHNPMEDGLDEKCTYCRDEKKAREEWEARQAEAGPDGVDFTPEDRPTPEPTEPATDADGYLILDENESEEELLALANGGPEGRVLGAMPPDGQVVGATAEENLHVDLDLEQDLEQEKFDSDPSLYLENLAREQNNLPKSVADIVTYMHRNDPKPEPEHWAVAAGRARLAGIPQNAPTTPETPRKVRVAAPVLGATAALPLGHTWVFWEQPSMKGRCKVCGKIEKSHLPK